jgi:hypothetical protein
MTTHSGFRSIFATVALSSVAAFGLAGCNLAQTSGASPTSTALGAPIAVSETEYSIALSPTPVVAGTYTFTVTNDGGSSHNLFISGPGIELTETPTIAPTQTASVTVTLVPGTYEIWSNVRDDKIAGMDVFFTVR